MKEIMQKKDIWIFLAAAAVLAMAAAVGFGAAQARKAQEYREHMAAAERCLAGADYEQAIAEYEAALRLEPDDGAVRQAMVLAYLAQTQSCLDAAEFEKADNILQTGLERTGSAVLEQRIQEVRKLKQEKEEAEKAAQKALIAAKEEGAEEARQEAERKAKEEIATPLKQCVTQILASIVTNDMSAEEKLRVAYQYVLDHTSYKRTYETPEGDWTEGYALQLLTTGEGNCFRYAAAFASLAKGLGYQARVATGQIRAARGGLTPHGWTEILIGEEWYIFDPDMEDAKKQDYYWKTYENYPVKPLNKEKEWSVEF